MSDPTSAVVADVVSEYDRRREERRQEVAALSTREARLALGRLLMALGGVVLAWLAFGPKLLSSLWLLTPLATFITLAFIHDKVITARLVAERAVGFYDRGLARLEDRWIGRGARGDRFKVPHHPFADDLDLFGDGSLFQLLSTARTHTGEATLAAWLLEPATPAETRERQAAVRELSGELDLREALAVIGGDVRRAADSDSPAAWGGQPATHFSSATRFVTSLTGLVGVLALGGFLGGLLSLGQLLLVFAVSIALTSWLRSRVGPIVSEVERPARDLKQLASLLARLEATTYDSPLLVQLRATLDSQGTRPSERIARLDRLVTMLDSRRNPFFAPFAILIMWDSQLAFRIEAWRAESGPALARWLRTIGEYEALLALAGYAHERPDDSFPELLDDGLRFDAEELGHPLLPRASVVRNDLRLAEDVRLLLVSGSNMSGKSTLLRTVGANAVLAFAGAPVRAARLTLSPFTLGASIRVQDSLQEGASRFYAEITRLRQVLDLTGGDRHVLFLLDEILHGTNSHDRRIGAEAVVRGLLERDAIGLVTTHDLALSKIAERPDNPAARNVHFEDHLEDGKMVFDYRMQDGVVEKSNALALMRAVGLKV